MSYSYRGNSLRSTEFASPKSSSGYDTSSLGSSSYNPSPRSTDVSLEASPRGYGGLGYDDSPRRSTPYNDQYGSRYRNGPIQENGVQNRQQDTGQEDETKHAECEYWKFAEDLVLEHVPTENHLLEINGGVGNLGLQLRKLGYDQIDLVDNVASNVREATQIDAYNNVFQEQYGHGEVLNLHADLQYGCVIVNGTNDVIIDLIDQLLEEKLAPGGYGVLIGSSTTEKSRSTDILQYITRKRMGNIRVLFWKRTRLPHKNGRTLDITRIVLKKRHD